MTFKEANITPQTCEKTFKKTFGRGADFGSVTYSFPNGWTAQLDVRRGRIVRVAGGKSHILHIADELGDDPKMADVWPLVMRTADFPPVTPFSEN